VFKLIYTAQARKDYQKTVNTPLLVKIRELLVILETNPFQNPPPFEKLTGNLNGAFSRKINRQHRLVYENDEFVDVSSKAFTDKRTPDKYTTPPLCTKGG
jgi:Txe/YoeB family toxin of toxin-antitoxin system